MSKGDWAFIQEWTIYKYMNKRFKEGNLRLKCIYVNNKDIRKDKWLKVKMLDEISQTVFPDIKGIKLQHDDKKRPAEIKFKTSLFKYHIEKKYEKKIRIFKENNGLIIVLKHDHKPTDYNELKLDIFEIDKSDFIAYCRENFVQLLNEQIKDHTESKVWLMYQAPNFNKSTSNVREARISKIWCPTENLSSFDLGTGDRILFIKTKEATRQQIQNNYNDYKNKWSLSEIVIAEITSKIMSREEYVSKKRLDPNIQLWALDPQINGKWRFNRVFEFKIIKTINPNIKLSELEKQKRITNLSETVSAIREVYYSQRARKLELDEYRDLIEYFL